MWTYACGDGATEPPATAGSATGSATVTVDQEVSAVLVTPAADTVVAGDTLRLAAEATDANGHPVAGADFDWMPSDTLVVVVDDAGLVTGVGAGEAAAAAAGVAGRAALSVVAPAPTAAEVTPDTVALTALSPERREAHHERSHLGAYHVSFARLLDGPPDRHRCMRRVDDGGRTARGSRTASHTDGCTLFGRARPVAGAELLRVWNQLLGSRRRIGVPRRDLFRPEHHGQQLLGGPDRRDDHMANQLVVGRRSLGSPDRRCLAAPYLQDDPEREHPGNTARNTTAT